MTDHLRIAMFAGTFPMVSETFIVRQITGLLALGHEVDIYSNSRPHPDGPVHPEVIKHNLLERTSPEVMWNERSTRCLKKCCCWNQM